MDNLLVRDLAYARRLKEQIKSAMKYELDKLTNSPEYRELEASLQKAVQTEKECEGKVKDAAFATFEASGQADKHPHEAVTIKEFTRCEITDHSLALKWCITNFTPALSLDEKMFVDLAKKGGAPEELVKLSAEFKATISQDLSGYLDVT